MSELLDLDTARARLLQALQPLPGEVELALPDALGRVLARTIQAPIPLPPFANAAMDGYAIRSADAERAGDAGLQVVDTALAGHPAQTPVGPGQTVRIFTGAAMPAEADMVVAQEDATPLEGGRVCLQTTATPGRFVRDAGADMAAGATLVTAGSRLHARHLALLAAAGVDRLPVRNRPGITLISTGDELRDPGTTLQPGQIFDANRYALAALLADWPVCVNQIVRVGDAPDAIAAAFDRAAQSSDVIICSGGVSVGDADHVRSVLAEHGQVDFWRLAMKPGRPFTFGHYRGKPFFGLPGNPVSSVVTALLLLRPALWHIAGAEFAPLQLRARLASPLAKTPGRRDFQRGYWYPDAGGQLQVTPLDGQESNMLAALSNANCLIDVPRETGDLDIAAEVDILPL